MLDPRSAEPTSYRADAEGYQPSWVTVAEIAFASGHTDVADRALAAAIDLTNDPHVAEHLRRHRP